MTYLNITSYGETEMIYITFDRQVDFITEIESNLIPNMLNCGAGRGVEP